MKSIFDSRVTSEIESRISALKETAPAQWGKMNAFQMLRHCTMCDDMMLGKVQIKRKFIGRLIGKMILNKVLRDDSPFGRNSPTAPMLVTLNQTGDFDQQKKDWIEKLKQYETFDNFNFVHPFFGPMSKEQIGIFAYKHADHHLRQFGA